MRTNKNKILSKKKADWAKNRDVILHGDVLNYNASLQAKYQSEIQALVLRMNAQVKKELTQLFKSEKYQAFQEQQEQAFAIDTKQESISQKAKKVLSQLDETFSALFALNAPKLAERMINRTKKYSETSLRSSLKKLSGGLTINTGIVPEGLKDIAQAIIEENVSLIKSIPSQYFTQITGVVMRSISNQASVSDIIKKVQKYSGKSYERAKLIALDQTRKAYNSVNVERLTQIGVKEFIWRHSNAGQFPRESHEKISGMKFSFENLQREQAIAGVPEKDRGLPGYPVNCRCRISPIIDFGD